LIYNFMAFKQWLLQQSNLFGKVGKLDISYVQILPVQWAKTFRGWVIVFVFDSPETILLKHFNGCVGLTNLLYAYFFAESKTSLKLEISK